jgi:ABC-type polysaccharide/polyol phosphate transport system ATPase subunit
LPIHRKRYKKFAALENINLEIQKGEKVGIIGRNGSGKSTLLKIICGITYPTAGNITVDGKISAILELGSGFNVNFTGYENILFYGLILGFSKEEMENKINAIAEFSEIGVYINQPLKSYSSGMKARLAYSVAINIEPEILILDEVFSVGDKMFREKSLAKMEELWSKGTTVINVSHNLDNIAQYSDRVIWLHRGKIKADGKPDDVVDKYSMLHKRRKQIVLQKLNEK